MRLSQSLFIAAVMSAAQAQTPSGFKPQVNTQLQVLFNSTSVETAGIQLSKTTTATAPRLAIPNSMTNSSQTFIFMMLDLDVPPANGSTTRRIFLHALETGFKPTQQRASGSATLLASTETGPAVYLPPGPPAADTMVHRYVELLFEQPGSLRVSASQFANTDARINFDVEEFIAENRLKAPVAGNFFRVDPRANATGRGSPTSTGGMVRNSTVPFEGAAVGRSAPVALLGVVVGMALLAV